MIPAFRNITVKKKKNRTFNNFQYIIRYLSEGRDVGGKDFVSNIF